jgi:replication factor C large subunit
LISCLFIVIVFYQKLYAVLIKFMGNDIYKTGGKIAFSYHEETLEDILGNEIAIAELKRYADEIEKGEKRRPILISGPPGTGKSISARLIAEAHKWNIVELNASDYRDKESIDRLLLAASQSRTIFGKKNMILLDEIDELAPRFDKGAGSAISNMMKNSKSPIIFIANNRWDQNIVFLRTAVDSIEFKKLPTITVSKILARFVKRNGLKVEMEVIDVVAARSNGDARSAINDITVLDNAEPGSVDVIGMRDRKTDIFATLDKIFLSNTYSAPLFASANSDVDNDMLIRWIDENISKRYTDKQDLVNGYDMLSKASMFASRASRSQYYTYWRYMNVYMSSGIALSKGRYPDQLRRYSFPKVISSLSQTKERRGLRMEVARKLKKKIHVNTSRIIKYEMHIIADMARDGLKDKENEQKTYDFFAAKYGLEPQEVDWLVENVVN